MRTKMPLGHHPCRVINISSVRCAKKFLENENEFAFSVMEQNPLYGRFMPASKIRGMSDNFELKELMEETSSFKSSEVVDLFYKMSRSIKNTNITLEDSRFTNICADIMKLMEVMSDEELLLILHCISFWTPTESTRSVNFMELWNAIDKECTKRCSGWSTEMQIRTGNLWYFLRLNRISKYNKAVIRELMGKLQQLEKQEFIQLLMFLNLERYISASDADAVEKRLLQYGHNLSVSEYAIVALGFFKCRRPLKSQELLQILAIKIEDAIDEENMIAFTALIKCLRKSAVSSMWHLYAHLQRHLLSKISKLNEFSMTHLVMVGLPIRICNTELLLEVIKHFSLHLKTLRLKELSICLFCAVTYVPENPLCREYCYKLINELKSPERQPELQFFRYQLISILLYMAYLKIYEEHFLSRVLTAEYYYTIKGSDREGIGRELFVLHHSYQIDNPNKKSRIKEPVVKKLFHYHPEFEGNHEFYSYQALLTSEFFSLIKSIVGNEDCCLTCRILPYNEHRDILLTCDQNNIPEPYPDYIKKLRRTEVLIPPSNKIWYAIVIGGRTFFNRETKEQLGFYKMKFRHLKQLGYQTLEIPWFDVTNLEERGNYTRSKLMTAGILKS